MAQNEFTVTRTKRPEVKPAAPAAAKPDEKPPTPEELEEQKSDFAASMGFAKPEPKPAKNPDEKPKPAAEPEKPAAEKPPVAEAPPKPAVAPKKPRVASTESIIEKTAAATARAIADNITGKREDEVAAEPAASELRPADRKEVVILKKLAELNPEKYGKSPEEFQTWCDKLYKYEEDWLKANPGEQFDIDAAEHAEFVEKNQPDIDGDDYDEAKLDVKAEEVYQRKMAPIEQQRRVTEAVEAARPTIVKNVTAGVFKIIENVSPELAQLLKGENGEVVINKETFKKIEDADPIAAENLEPMVVNAAHVLTALEQLAIPGISIPMAPDKNPAHAKIMELAGDYERAMKGAPDSVRIINGREFITAGERAARLDKIQKSKLTPETKAKKVSELGNSTWSVGVDEISALLIDEVSTKAKAAFDKSDALAKKKYGSERRPADPNYVPPVIPVKPPVTREKPKAPSIAGGADKVNGGSPAGGGEEKFAETATTTMFG